MSTDEDFCRQQQLHYRVLRVHPQGWDSRQGHLGQPGDVRDLEARGLWDEPIRLDRTSIDRMEVSRAAFRVLAKRDAGASADLTRR